MYASALPDPELNADFYAGVPAKRALAWIVDTILTVIITAVIVPFTAFTALFFLPFLYLMVSFFYRWISLASRSATPGMRMMAIEFRRADGQKFDAATAFLHTLGFLISFAMVLPQVLSAVLMLFGDRRQGLSDLALGTVAIKRAARF